MKPIHNYKYHYSVTEDARVFSHKSNIFLKQGISTSGYNMVVLCKNGIPKTQQVHTLVASAYIPDVRSCMLYVNHKDGNKQNNNVDNLEWVTPSENMKHAILNRLTPKPPSWKGKTGAKHNRSVSIHQLDVSRSVVRTFGSMAEAEREMGYSGGVVSFACRDKRQTRDGFYYEKSHILN